MPDLFGYQRAAKAKAAFSSELSLLTFGSNTTDLTDVAGMMIQSWNLNYQQQVTEAFELGSSNLYWVKGRPVGQGQISRILGPKGTKSTKHIFPDEAFDICDGGATFRIQGSTGLCDDTSNSDTIAESSEYVMGGCLVSSVGASADIGGDSRMMENIAWRFAHLED